MSKSPARLRARLRATRQLSRRAESRRFLLERLEPRQLLAGDVVRSIDGSGNNLTNPDWGAAGEDLLRIAPADYADGVSSPAGADRPSAREVSNAIVDHGADDTHSDRQLSAYIYVWGQFLDHDIDLTPSGGVESFPIEVPDGDPYFDPTGAGNATIPLSRSVFDAATGTVDARQQLNLVTAWIDGSMVYGSDDATAASLRTFSGGHLRTSEGELLPVDSHGFFQAGDVRANENIELSSMQTLFVREHNRLADQLAAANPSLTDEQLYQRARAQVIAEIQVVTYREFLPALIGANALPRYRGYDPTVNPQIANEFSTALYRLHTMINDDVEFFDNDGRPLTFTYVNDAGETVEVDGGVPLSEAFFNPTLLRQAGVDGVLKYAGSTLAEEIDTKLVDSLRNFLIASDAPPLLDLASLNIQRGRDHGLADYNTVRESYGLPRVTSFAQITSNTDLQAKLAELYGDVDHIDLWVGAMAEDHVRGASVGPLVQRALADQFARLRDGDRFWYQRVFSGRQLAELERTTLSDIIERNTGVDGLQSNLFYFRAEAGGVVYQDRNGNGRRERTEAPLAGIKVQLLNGDGEVVDTTITGRDGRYTFRTFPETGDYQIVADLPTGAGATTSQPLSLLVAAGDARFGNLDIGVRLGRTPRGATPAPTPAPTNLAGGAGRTNPGGGNVGAAASGVGGSATDRNTGPQSAPLDVRTARIGLLADMFADITGRPRRWADDVDRALGDLADLLTGVLPGA